MTKYTTIIITLLFTTACFGQITEPIDTAKIRGLKKEFLYDVDGFFFKKKNLRWVKYFDTNGKLILQEVYINGPITPLDLNKYYYNVDGKIAKRDHLTQIDSLNSYTVDITRNYSYKNGKLYNITEYKDGQLNGRIIYKDTIFGQVARCTYFLDDTTKIGIHWEEYFNSNGKLFKHISDIITDDYYYYKDGRDSMTYSLNYQKPHSKEFYSYPKNQKIVDYIGILFPDTSRKVYFYNKNGDIIKRIDNMNHKNSKATFKYYKNGLIKSTYSRYYFADRYNVDRTFYKYEYY